MLTSIDEAAVDGFLKDPDYGLMEKFDGDRRAIWADYDPRGINKLGQVVPVASALAKAICELPFGTIIDGELIGDVYYAFDLLAYGATDVCSEAFQRRHELLRQVATESGIVSDTFRIAPLFTGDEKAAAFAELRDANKEGVVFKRMDGRYTAGRDTTTNTAIKFKWYATATIRIAGKTPGKNSLIMEMFCDGKPVRVGSVTIAPSMEVPPVGAYAEVRYLYIQSVGGALYQPTFLRLRDDVDDRDCDTAQLKLKPAATWDTLNGGAAVAAAVVELTLVRSLICRWTLKLRQRHDLDPQLVFVLRDLERKKIAALLGPPAEPGAAAKAGASIKKQACKPTLSATLITIGLFPLLSTGWDGAWPMVPCKADGTPNPARTKGGPTDQTQPRLTNAWRGRDGAWSRTAAQHGASRGRRGPGSLTRRLRAAP
jgi:hypothetical protein